MLLFTKRQCTLWFHQYHMLPGAAQWTTYMRCTRDRRHKGHVAAHFGDLLLQHTVECFLGLDSVHSPACEGATSNLRLVHVEADIKSQYHLFANVVSPW